MAETASREFVAKAKELSESGQFGKAIETLKAGLEKHPKMVSARVLLGEVYLTSGDLANARVELENVIQTAPDNFAAYRKLALVYKDLGDTHSAAKACEIILQANPKDKEMGHLLEELLKEPASDKAKGDGKKEKAKAAPAKEEAAQEEAPKPTKTTLKLDESPVAAHHAEEPSSELTLEIHEPEETDSETLAELYVTQGHRDKALDVYRRLSEKDPDNMKLHERIMALEEEAETPKAAAKEEPKESAAQATRKARIRRLEGWLSVIRERRRT